MGQTECLAEPEPDVCDTRPQTGLFRATLRANIAETLSVVAIREQGEKEDQHDSQEHRTLLHCDVGYGPTQ